MIIGLAVSTRRFRTVPWVATTATNQASYGPETERLEDKLPVETRLQTRGLSDSKGDVSISC